MTWSLVSKSSQPSKKVGWWGEAQNCKHTVITAPIEANRSEYKSCGASRGRTVNLLTKQENGEGPLRRCYFSQLWNFRLAEPSFKFRSQDFQVVFILLHCSLTI